MRDTAPFNVPRTGSVIWSVGLRSSLLRHDDLDPELDDVSNQLLLEISDTIRAECERILRR